LEANWSEFLRPKSSAYPNQIGAKKNISFIPPIWRYKRDFFQMWRRSRISVRLGPYASGDSNTSCSSNSTSGNQKQRVAKRHLMPNPHKLIKALHSILI